MSEEEREGGVRRKETMASVEVDLGLLKPLRFVGQMDSTSEVTAHHLRERWGSSPGFYRLVQGS